MISFQQSPEYLQDVVAWSRQSKGRAIHQVNEWGCLTTLPCGGFCGTLHENLARGRFSFRFLNPGLLLVVGDVTYLEDIEIDGSGDAGWVDDSLIVLARDIAPIVGPLRRTPSLITGKLIGSSYRILAGTRATTVSFAPLPEDLGSMTVLWRDVLQRHYGLPSNVSLPPPIPLDRSIKLMIAQLINPPVPGSAHEHYIRAKGVELLCQLANSKEDMRLREEVASVRAQIRDKPCTELNIRELAASVSLSTRHLTRIFKEEVGMTLAEYLLEVRLNQAAEFLTQSDRRIQDIAYALGFEETGRLSRMFKQRFGATPSKFRQSQIDRQTRIH